jgi:lysozyme
LKVFKRPEFYPIRGIDLSQFSGEVPFDELIAHDIRFAYIKASEGGESTDPAFDDMLKGAQHAAILTGAYHFFTFCDSAESQFANIARRRIEATDLPFAVDVEWFDGPANPNQRPCAQNVDTVKDNLRRLLTMIKERYHKIPLIYAPPSTIGSIIDDSFNEYPIWLADYRKVEGLSRPTMRGHNPWTLWQFTDRARIPGLGGPADLNVFFGSEDQFTAFAKGEGNIALQAAQAP